MNSGLPSDEAHLVLVDIMRSLFVLVTLLLTGCVATPPVVSGPYAAVLSPSDIQQIQRAVSDRPTIEHRVRTLEAQRPNRIYVQTGRGPSVDDWSGNAFYVIKRSGRWYIDDRSPIASIARVPAIKCYPPRTPSSGVSLDKKSKSKR